jgi:hypothetical protein
MRQKSFLILAGVTGIAILAAAGSLLTGGGAPAFAAAGDRLFPNLVSSASDVAKLSIRHGDFDFDIELRDGKFVEANSGYPVDPEPLKALVSGMMLAQIAEAKTTDPERHRDLQLADPTADEGAGHEVVLANKDGNKLAHVVAGERDYTLGGVTGGQFVRRGGEDASWLVHGRLDPPTSRKGWFDNRLVEVEAKEISSASLTTSDGQVISMQGSDGKLSIDPELLGERVQADDKLGRVVALFESLDFDDVRNPVETSSTAESESVLQSTLTDGTVVTLAAFAGADSEEPLWVRIGIEGETETASNLKAKTEGFEFALSSFDADIFDWTMEDLTERAEN